MIEMVKAAGKQDNFEVQFTVPDPDAPKLP